MAITYKRQVTRSIAAAAGIVAIVGGATVASAEELTVSPEAIGGVYASGTKLAITYRDPNIRAGEDYQVSVCTQRTIGGLIPAPACVAPTGGSTVVDGAVSATVALSTEMPDVHKFLRPLSNPNETFTCTIDNPCTVKVVDHRTIFRKVLTESAPFSIQ